MEIYEFAFRDDDGRRLLKFRHIGRSTVRCLSKGRPAGMKILSVSLLVLLMVPTGLVSAKSIYKYQDGDGHWHYTDISPNTDQPVARQHVEVAPRSKVIIRNQGSELKPQYYVYNDYYGPVEVHLALSNAENVLSDLPMPATVLVPPRQEVRALGLEVMNPSKSYRYRLKATSVLGPPDAREAPDVTYRIPFAGGSAYEVTQAFFGEFSHNSPESEYAVDIAMPEGTPIVAARDGVVMDVNRDFSGNGDDFAKYAARANAVRILHDDGTMAEYAHLKLESVRVIPGSRVRAGQVIAESGNTGFSTGPHLHFVIQKNDGAALRSIPFTFRLEDGTLIKPQEKTRLAGY